MSIIFSTRTRGTIGLWPLCARSVTKARTAFMGSGEKEGLGRDTSSVKLNFWR